MKNAIFYSSFGQRDLQSKYLLAATNIFHPFYTFESGLSRSKCFYSALFVVVVVVKKFDNSMVCLRLIILSKI